MEPDLQDPQEAMVSKIVGCQKKLLSNGQQTYNIGKKLEPVPQDPSRKEMLTKKTKSAIF